MDSLFHGEGRLPLEHFRYLHSAESGAECWLIGATSEEVPSSKYGAEQGTDSMSFPQRAEHERHFPDEDQERAAEARKVRRLQVMISMVMSVISQDPNLTVEEASELAAGAKKAALAMFPDKELAFDLLYKPRLQRLMKERFHLQ